MKALRNFLSDLSFQFKISGGLIARLICLNAYWIFYEANRIRGMSRDESRLKALARLSRLGSTRRLTTIVFPDGTVMTLDILAATFMPKEFLIEKMYSQLPQFLPQKGQTVVDVGAHQGIFSIMAARRVGTEGRVIAVEPCPRNFELLCQNKMLNKLANLAISAQAASDFDGDADLFLADLVSGGHSLVFQSEPAPGFPLRKSISVPVNRLDRILERERAHKIDLIKIDVEGSALNVLKGAPTALAGRPRVVLEVENGDQDISLVREHLENLGYRVVQYGGILYAEAAGVKP